MSLNTFISLSHLLTFSWISAATGVVSFFLFVPGIFPECYISEKELEALKTLATKENMTENTGKNLVRRISRVVERQASSGPNLTTSQNEEKMIRRRISRVAMQEVESERHQMERMQSSSEKLLSNLRKYSMSSPHDTNITMTDPALETEIEEDEMMTGTRRLPPLVPVLILIYCNFSFLFNYVLLETLTSTLAMDQWAWKPETAVRICREFN